MILYHGSTVIVKNPSLRQGRPNTDFGKGFYTTIDFAFSKDEDKQELIGLWELLNNHLDMDKSVFITRVTSYSSSKKFQKKFDVPADVLAEWDLMNNLQRLFNDPKTRIKTKTQFHVS